MIVLLLVFLVGIPMAVVIGEGPYPVLVLPWVAMLTWVAYWGYH